MIETQKNFLPTQQTILARRFCGDAMLETIVSSLLRPARGAGSSVLASPSLNEAITLFGEDGAAEFVGAGFRVQAEGRR